MAVEQTKQVKIPDPKLQYEKTPAKIKKIIQVVDETGQTVNVERWVDWIETSGEESKVIKWHEWKKKLLKAADHTLDELKIEIEKMGGSPKKDSKKGVYAGIIELYKRRKVSDEEYAAKTTEDFEAEIEDYAVRQGRWSLGCPYNCGRSWTFKPTDDLTGFEPEDPAAMKGFDEKGNPTKGYLSWQPQPDGSVIFTCDRCGGIVELIK